MNIGSIIHIILLLLTPFISIYWAVCILVKPEKLKIHYTMAALLFSFTIAYFLFISYFTPSVGPLVDVLYSAVALMIPVIHIEFYKQFTDPENKSIRIIWMVIPNSFLIVGLIAMYILMGHDASDLFVNVVVLGKDYNVPVSYMTTTWKIQTWLSYYFFRIVFLTEILFVQIWSFIRLTRYNKRLDEYFSDTNRYGHKTNIILYCSTLCALIAAIALLAQPFHKLSDNSLLFVSMSIITTVAMFCVGYSSYRLAFSADKMNELLARNNEQFKEPEIVILPKSDELELSDKAYAMCVKGLMKLAMDKEFLNPDLTLIDVATKIGTNRTYLTKVIHSYFNSSFSDYINLLRVEYSEKLLQERRDMNMLEVALASGFTTLSSFYRNFQKFTGTTPARWINAN